MHLQLVWTLGSFRHLKYLTADSGFGFPQHIFPLLPSLEALKYLKMHSQLPLQLTVAETCLLGLKGKWCLHFLGNAPIPENIPEAFTNPTTAAFVAADDHG